MADDRQTKDGQQSVVEPLYFRIDGLERRADQVRRDAYFAPLELTIMEEPQSRRQVCDNRRRLVHRLCERCGRARLVVILHEARELVLIVEAGEQMLACRSGMT